MPTVRTAKKLVLGWEIEHMMKQANASPADVAAILSTSRSRVGQIVAGQGTVSIGDLERLATQLGFVDPGYHAALFALRKDSHKRGYWTSGWRRAYSEEVRLRVDIEGHSDRLRAFEVEVVPGLCQHEDYVRGLYEGEPEFNGLTLEDHVQARLARQQIFDAPKPPVVHFVMSESCIRRVRCDKPAMVKQLQHMVELSQRENVFLQLLPFDRPVGRRTSITNRFTLLRIPSPGVAGPLELAYTEDVGEFRYIDEKVKLDAYDQRWARLTAAALGFDESRDFLRQVAAELS